MPKHNNDVNTKLDEVISLLQHLVILELSRDGLSQGEIAKRLGIAKLLVNKVLKGIEYKD